MDQPKNALIRRGAIFYADFGSQPGSTIKGIRPAMIVQNNTGNQYAKTIIVAPVVPLQKQKRHPTHVTINSEFGLCGDRYPNHNAQRSGPNSDPGRSGHDYLAYLPSLCFRWQAAIPRFL